MRKLAAALAALVPLAAVAQALRAPTIGESFETMDALRLGRRAPFEQTLVLPERPGQNQVAWYEFAWQYVDVPAPGGG